MPEEKQMTAKESTIKQLVDKPSSQRNTVKVLKRIEYKL